MRASSTATCCRLLSIIPNFSPAALDRVLVARVLLRAASGAVSMMSMS
jgi:hypothetical protein